MAKRERVQWILLFGQFDVSKKNIRTFTICCHDLQLKSLSICIQSSNARIFACKWIALSVFWVGEFAVSTKINTNIWPNYHGENCANRSRHQAYILLSTVFLSVSVCVCATSYLKRCFHYRRHCRRRHCFIVNLVFHCYSPICLRKEEELKQNIILISDWNECPLK